MSSLTAEQQKLIEEKKRKALELRLKTNEAKRFAPDTKPLYLNGKNNTENYSFNSSSNNSTLNVQNSPAREFFNISSTSKQLQAFYGSKNATTCKMSLISESRFCVDMSKFNSNVINVFKTMPNYKYDKNTKIWSFNLNDYEDLIKKLKELQNEVIIDPLPNVVLKCIRFRKARIEDIESKINNIDSKLLDTLMAFQKEGVRFALERNGRCLIADDMGLGKTFQALAIACCYRENWPVLIVTTSSMKNTWFEKIQEYITSVPSMYVQYMQKSKDYISDAKVLIISYDMMSRAFEILQERNFGILILDESHALKNFKTKCAQVAQKLAKQAKRVVLLTGTPALSRPNELFTQLQIIDSSCFHFKEYSTRYCDGHQTNFGWDSNGQSNLQELEIILSVRFMIRRTKSQVLGALPIKTRESVKLDQKMLELSESDSKQLQSMANDYSLLKKSSDKRAALLTFFSETARIKSKAVCAYISTVLEEHKKFLLFGHHQVMLDTVCELLEHKKINYIRIDGRTNSDQRQFFVNRFQCDDKYRCAVLSITATNAGITLTAAEMVIFAELHWNPSILSQAESRAHRIGQEKDVRIIYLLGEGTVDDYIWPLIQEKQNILNEAGLSNDCFEGTESSNQELNESFQKYFDSRINKLTNYFQSDKNKSKSDEKINDNDERMEIISKKKSGNLNKNENFSKNVAKENLELNEEELEAMFSDDF